MARVTLWATTMLYAALSYGAGEKLYVQSTKATIYADASFQAAVIDTANKGDEVLALESRGTWHKVSFKEKSGWVSSLLLAPQPPQGKITVINEQESPAQNDSARRRVSTTSSAAAARGLRSDERGRVSDEGKANYPALEKVERTTVNENEVREFQREARP